MRATAKNAGFGTQITFSNHGKAFTRMYQKHKHDNGVNYQYAERKCAQSGAHLPVVYDAENAKELIQGLGSTESHIPVGLKLYKKRSNSLEPRFSNHGSRPKIGSRRNFFYESNMGRGTYTETDNWVAAKIS